MIRPEALHPATEALDRIVPPALAEALRPIGWTHARTVAPLRAFRLACDMIEAPEARSRATIGAERDRIVRLADAMAATLPALDALTPEDRATLALGAGSDAVGATRAAFEALAEGVVFAFDNAEAEAQRQPRTGRQRNEAAFRIARACAAVAVVGTGRKPGYGRREDNGQPAGPFAAAVAAACAALGVEVADVLRPCREAVQALDDEAMRDLLACHRGERRAERLSMFDLGRMAEPVEN